MPFDRPTLTELVTRALSDIQTRITGAETLLRRSVLRVLAKVQAGANHLLYGYLDYIMKQTFVLYADEFGLRDHGLEWGIDRDEANTASGNITATGTNGVTIPAGSELSSDDDEIYTTDAAGTIALGTVTIAITAQQAGANGNQSAATVLTFVSPPNGIDANATVDSDGLSGGENIEDVEDWREKILARKRNPPHGGAENDYVVWMLEVDGVTRAWVFPLYNGAGTVGCAFVRDAESPIVPSASEIATVEAYIIEHTDPTTGKTVGIPVTAEPGLIMITLTTKAIDLTVSIFPNTTAIQNAVSDLIDDALETYGGPGETVYLSQLNKEIARAADLEYFRIDSPATDISAAQTEVHIPGTYTYQNY